MFLQIFFQSLSFSSAQINRLTLSIFNILSSESFRNIFILAFILSLLMGTTSNSLSIRVLLRRIFSLRFELWLKIGVKRVPWKNFLIRQSEKSTVWRLWRRFTANDSEMLSTWLVVCRIRHGWLCISWYALDLRISNWDELRLEENVNFKSNHPLRLLITETRRRAGGLLTLVY